MNVHDFYSNAKPQIIEIDDAALAVRTFGQGAPLLLIHGFFVNGYTWRKLLPALSKKFTCYVIDLPGFGDSVYSKKTNFTFTAQAKRLSTLIDLLGINNQLNVIAHDTGASIARLTALEANNAIKKLILINTEIPNHRPPFIQMYQKKAKLPFANLAFRLAFKSDKMITSPLVLDQFFYNKSLFKDKTNYQHYVTPFFNKDKMFGMLEYLKGIEWDVVDDFANTHTNIPADTLLLWGAEDKTFPVKRAKEMVDQFNGNCKLVEIEKTCLMPHEEKPEEVVKAILDFLTDGGTAINLE